MRIIFWATKEAADRTKIMEAYRLKFISLPHESLLIYTDGGRTKQDTDQEEECGWGYSVRIQYKKYPQDKVDDGTYQAKQISDDWGGGHRVEIHCCWSSQY